MSEEPPEHATARKERASEYLFFSLGSIAIGLIAGLIFFVIYYVGVGIEPSDQSYVFGYAVRGGIGSLLYHVSIGAIGGLVFGVPYFIAWLMQTWGEKMGQH